MIDISELLIDPLFSQSFQLHRYGAPVYANEGEASSTTTVLDRVGVIQPAKQNDVIQYLPEGQRQGSFIGVYCAQDIRMGDGKNQLPDVVVHRGQNHRVVFSKNWSDFGYWFAIATAIRA